MTPNGAQAFKGSENGNFFTVANSALDGGARGTPY